jgi:23S rRNA (adenine-N6)-dimethyltransferase
LDDQRTKPRSGRDARRRTLSQNFLRDKGAVEWFVDVAGLSLDGLVLEVGGGDGIITEQAARRCRELKVYEIDPFYARQIKGRVAKYENVRVIASDFLLTIPPEEPFQVIGNVPFSTTGAVIDWCLGAATMESATFITQLEYARKRTGDFGRWSLLTILTWPLFRWELRGRISRTRFRPVPRVDAGVLRLDQRPRPLIPFSRMRVYERMVQLGFSGVGGSLYASLSTRFTRPRVLKALEAAGVGRDCVVAFVEPEQWISIFESLDADSDLPADHLCSVPGRKHPIGWPQETVSPCRRSQ